MKQKGTVNDRIQQYKDQEKNYQKQTEGQPPTLTNPMYTLKYSYPWNQKRNGKKGKKGTK